MITEEHFVDFQCPHCGELATFPRDSAGTAQECPNCAECLVVPGDDASVGGVLPLSITTPRLVLRRLNPNDWKDLLEFLSDEELFLYSDARPLGEEEILRWLDADSHVRLTTPNAAFNLGMELREGGKLVGYVSLTFIDALRQQVALNVLLNRSHQRQGLASEAVTAVLRFCFCGIGLHRVTVSCDGRNTPARRLCERVGLRQEGEFRKDRFVDGQWANTLWWAMLAEDHRESADQPLRADTR